MPTRINDVTLLFTSGEKPVPELAWWTAGFTNSGIEYTKKCPLPTDRLFTNTAYNYWLRRGPFNLDTDGTVKHDMYLYAPKVVLDSWLEPKTNEWGDICP